MPSWFWKTPTENKEFNTWGLSIEYIAWGLILVSCVCIVRNQIQIHLSVYSTHLHTWGALQTAIWSYACTAFCSHDAISRQSGLCRNRMLGRGIAWEWAFTFPLLYNDSWRVSSNWLACESAVTSKLWPVWEQGCAPFLFHCKVKQAAVIWWDVHPAIATSQQTCLLY